MPATEQATTGTVRRYRLIVRNGKYAWQWSYDVHLSSCTCAGDHCGWHGIGRGLAIAERWLRDRGATEIRREWA